MDSRTEPDQPHVGMEMDQYTADIVARPDNPQCHRDTACTGKRRYPSKHQAKIARKSIESSIGKPTRLMAYRCVYCGGFHLGCKEGGRELMDLDQVFINTFG